MQNFTLIESGTSRTHFQLAKSLEEAAGSEQSDDIVLQTVAQIRDKVAKQLSSADPSKYASTLLPLLHCLNQYPQSSSTRQPIDISFCLLPTLQLISLASKWSHVLIAHALLKYLFPPSEVSNHVGVIDSNSTPLVLSSDIQNTSDQDSSSSLLLLNTFRKHLIQGATTNRPHTLSSDYGSRSRSNSRNSHLEVSSDAHLLSTLSLLSRGVPSGPQVLPSLATPLLNLTRHPDPLVRRQALNAMWRCSMYESIDDDLLEPSVSSGLKAGGEMIQATLQVVRQMLASTYSFETGLDMENDTVRDTVRQIEKRVETDPSVLRAAIRIVDHARNSSVITVAEATCHAIEILEAIEWSSHHDLAHFQAAVPDHITIKLGGLRARSSAKARHSVSQDYDYHGLCAPWLVLACTDSLSKSISLLAKEFKPVSSAFDELENMLLRIYMQASEGVDSALAICISSAKCLGHLYMLQQKQKQSVDQIPLQRESAALWQTVSLHVKHQLLSNNANRKIVALELLDALRPLGWADSAEQQQGSKSSVLRLDERAMDMLMRLLANRDDSVRRRALELLTQIDVNLIKLHLEQLQNALDGLVKSADKISHNQLEQLAVRLVETAYLDARLKLDSEASQQVQDFLGRSYASNILEAISKVESAQRDKARGKPVLVSVIGQVINDYRGLQPYCLFALFRHLTESAYLAATSNEERGGQTLPLLLSTIACDLDKRDMDAVAETLTDFLPSISTLADLLIYHDTVEIKEALIAALARLSALFLSVNQDLSLQLDNSISGKLRKVIEGSTSSQGKAFQVECQSLLSLVTAPDEKSIETLSVSFQTIPGIIHALLELDSHSPAFSMRDAAKSDARSVASYSENSPKPSLIRSTLFENSTETIRTASVDRKLLRSEDTLLPRSSTTSSSPSSSYNRTITVSAIPTEAKRTRDKQIEQAMSASISQLVLGNQASQDTSNQATTPTSTAAVPQNSSKAVPSPNVLFSADEEELLVSLDDDQLPIVDEVEQQDEFAIHLAEGESPSLLDLVHECHNHNPWHDASLTPFVCDGVQIGFLQPIVVSACITDSTERKARGEPVILRLVHFGRKRQRAITFADTLTDPETRTAGLLKVAQSWRTKQLFPDPLDGWRNEAYSIYSYNPTPTVANPPAFQLERSACALFGFATYGVHLTAYTSNGKIWVPQRSFTKSTWPGYLDNSVAGGITAGNSAFKTILRECEEEASLPSDLVSNKIKATGILTYFYQTKKFNWIQPEVEYIYDLLLDDEKIVLKPKDQEGDHFKLLSYDTVLNLMKQGKFKPNCILVLLDFFIRHGYLQSEQVPNYQKLVNQIHTDLRLPGP